ncbi:hypothetical protein [Aeromicrobium sp. 179-A 4D2 NHS]|uniref:hypothetical protein n=1 Tax=Aeromicrobium sp. 179-A 4D2 NHS TaxID=3142375 RepID=UPI0039A02B7A
MTGQPRATNGQWTEDPRSEPSAVTVTDPDDFTTRFDRDHRLIIHNTLLAQVDDNHAGGVYGWGVKEHRLAEALFYELEADPTHGGVFTDNEGKAILYSLVHSVHDIDHSDMSDGQWDAAESMLSRLAEEFGR